MAKQREGYVQNKILSYFKKLDEDGHPIMYEKRQAGGFSYKEGIPDIWCVYDGLHIEIEVKADDGVQRTMQEKYQLRCERRNIIYLLVDDYPSFKKAFDNFINYYNDRGGIKL